MSHCVYTMPRTLLAGAVIVAAGAPVASSQVPTQQPLPSTTQMVLKGKAPVSKEVLKVKLPKPSDASLPNGLRVMVLEDHRLPQVTFQLVIPGAGGYYDPDNQPGLAGFVAAMMREGTATRTSEQVSGALETMGASLSFGAGASSRARKRSAAR